MLMTLDTLSSYLAERFPIVLAAIPAALVVILAACILNFILARLMLFVARRTKLTPMDVQPARRLLRGVVIIITVLLVAGVFGFKLGGLWTFISAVLAMIAIGFVAVWSLLSHTSATVLLLFTRPFNIGDWIEFKSEDVQGRIIDINFFFATLQVDERTTYQVPNNLFFQKVIRRVAGPYHHSLAHQLSATTPAKLPPFPYPTGNGGANKAVEQTPASEDDAMKAIPDPATLDPNRNR